MDPLKVTQQQETKLHFLDYWRIIRIRKTVILAVFLLVVITATLVTFILPESFSSKARIKVERDVTDIEGMAGSRAYSQYDPFFIQNEFETIQSEIILGKVVELLSLNEEWGRRLGGGTKWKTVDSIAFLKSRMSLRPVRNTSFIEVEIFSEDRDEAMRIANAVADVYLNHRTQERLSRTTSGIKALEERYQEQQEKIKKAVKELEELRVNLQINDADAQGNAPTLSMYSEDLRRINALAREGEVKLVSLKTNVAALKSLSPERKMQVLPRTRQDSILTELLSQLNLVEQEFNRVKKDFAPEHPTYIRVRDQVSDLQRKVNDNVEAIMIALDNEVDRLQAEVYGLKKAVEDAQALDIEKAKAFRPYYDKKRELEELYGFARILGVKLASENIDLKLQQQSTSMVEIMDRAIPGSKPVRPNKALNIILGVIIGLVVGVGLAFFIEYLDTSVKTIDDVERSLQAPVLGVIPQNVSYLFDEGSESPHAEAYRVLRTNLLFSRKDDKLNSVAIVSAGAGEGKSTTVMNLATVFAQSGQRVVVVDSDLRRPTLHKMLRVTNSLGLTNYLLKQNTLEEVIQTTHLPQLDFLASGKLPSSSLGILSSAQMKDLINELKQRYDFVFFDSPPIMGVSDASILASEVDITLQVIQYRRYPQPMNIRAKQLIEKVGGNLVGIVLNNINMSQDESYYYYSGYYHDYYSKNEEMDATPGAGKDGGKGKVEIKQKY